MVNQNSQGQFIPRIFLIHTLACLAMATMAYSQPSGLLGLVQGANASADRGLTSEHAAEAADDSLRTNPGMAEESLHEAPSHADATASSEPPSTSLEVQTVSSSGEPLEGVAIHLVRSISSAPWTQVLADRPPQAKSDSEGVVTLENLPADTPIHLVFLHEGMVPEALFGLAPEMDSPVVVILHPTSGLRGRIVDEEGEPVVSAEVRTVVSGHRQTKEVRTQSDASGQFVFEGLESVTGLEISAPGFRPVRFSELEVGNGEPELQITLRLGERLVGTVLDSEGSPVSDAEVMLVEPEGGVRGEERKSRTDSEGVFELSGLSPGPRVLRASHPSYPPAALEVELEDGTTEVEVHFEEGLTIFGRVLDHLGIPLANIPVRARRLAGHRHRVFARTDFEGNFSLRQLEAGRYQLRAEPGDRAPATRVVELSPGQEAEVEFRLAQGATVTGVVLGLNPSAVSGVRVAARGAGHPRFATVQQDGSYRFENLSVGRWALQVNIAGRSAQNTLSIEPWAAEQGTELWLDLDLGGYTLSGVIRSRSEALVGAWVSLRKGMFWTRTPVAHDGTFRFEGLEADAYTLGVRDFATGLRYQQALVVEGDRALTFDFMPTVLHAQVREADSGIPLAGALVHLVHLSASGEQTASQQHSDFLGKVHLGEVEGGSWRVVAQRPGYVTSGVLVEPSGEPQQEVEVWLERDD